MKVTFYSQSEYDLWLASKSDFSQITDFWADNLPGVTVLPDLPACTDFWAHNLPGVTVLPDLPACTDFRAYNLPGVTVLPDLPACTYFRADKHIRGLRKGGVK